MDKERLNRMLSSINDQYDKTEGSFFYDNLKAVGLELDEADKKADAILDKGFAETSFGEWLDKKVAEQGIKRKPATKATTTVLITGSQGALINTGDKVASDVVTFVFKESKTIGPSGQESVLVECESFGTIGNVPAGAIRFFPVTLAGLTSVTNPEAVTSGYNGETNEELRGRYWDKVRTPATSGNKYHYRNWAKEVIGVGDARVFPTWDGPGTVKVVIINSNKRGADAQLVTNVATHIEEERPIGATVTVESAAELQINLSVTLIIDTDNYELDFVKVAIENNITNYLTSIAFHENYVSYAIVGSTILNTNGVLDYSGLTINGGAGNINILDTQVAVLGVLTVV
ncbi:baseplate J/gp47 family protein [Clostridium formicaceticum]|uniref:Baseplate J-like protein n=1 Tax=Clostridium formicaceticum TaxID=1497 RepID=A0AAC9RKT4_9CLOT|nr:baseplate J/gp47 family protein [Clostridium formicaceticum]AOY76691.1 hypothetical protein BJL90_12930 [Clostridium formicaceticum]ARE87123.1 Baseplate J-like protein [Clostridium formicaceticum]